MAYKTEDEKRAYNKRYWQKHKAKLHANHVAWKKANPERYRKSKQKWQDANRTRVRLINRWLYYRKKYMIAKDRLTKLGFEYKDGMWEPYQCVSCGKSFKQEGVHLIEHAEKHITAKKEQAMKQLTDMTPEELTAAILELKAKRLPGSTEVLAEEFPLLKELIKRGFTYQQITKMVGRSAYTLNNIASAKNYEDFLEIRLARSQKYNGTGEGINKKQPITETEYDQIKEMQYRGETAKDIIARSGRSHTVIALIRQAQSFQDYQQLMFQRNTNYISTKQSKEEPSTQQGEPLHYHRLREFREGLDRVLIEFINAEIRQSQKVVLQELRDKDAELTKLKEENEQLKDELRETRSKTNFIAALRQGLNGQ